MRGQKETEDKCAGGGQYNCGAYMAGECKWCTGNGGVCKPSSYWATEADGCPFRPAGCAGLYSKQQCLGDSGHACKWCTAETQGWTSCVDANADESGQTCVKA